MAHKKLYFCDPAENPECLMMNCFYCGNEHGCFLTSNEKYATRDKYGHAFVFSFDPERITDEDWLLCYNTGMDFIERVLPDSVTKERLKRELLWNIEKTKARIESRVEPEPEKRFKDRITDFLKNFFWKYKNRKDAPK